MSTFVGSNPNFEGVTVTGTSALGTITGTSLTVSDTSSLGFASASTLDVSGTAVFTSGLDAGGSQIANVALVPSAAGDATSKSYVDTAITSSTGPLVSSFMSHLDTAVVTTITDGTITDWTVTPSGSLPGLYQIGTDFNPATSVYLTPVHGIYKFNLGIVRLNNVSVVFPPSAPPSISILADGAALDTKYISGISFDLLSAGAGAAVASAEVQLAAGVSVTPSFSNGGLATFNISTTGAPANAFTWYGGLVAAIL